MSSDSLQLTETGSGPSEKRMLLLTYTPREGIDLQAYHAWLEDVDNPFFNNRPQLRHYANWQVLEAKLGSVHFTHFDLLEVRPGIGYEEVFSDRDIAAFARNWVRLWGRDPDPDAPDQSINYQVLLCRQIAAPARVPAPTVVNDGAA